MRKCHFRQRPGQLLKKGPPTELLISIKVIAPERRVMRGMKNGSNNVFERIEETQRSLRESIEQTKRLADQAEQLVRQVRNEPVQPPRSL